MYCTKTKVGDLQQHDVPDSTDMINTSQMSSRYSILYEPGDHHESQTQSDFYLEQTFQTSCGKQRRNNNDKTNPEMNRNLWKQITSVTSNSGPSVQNVMPNVNSCRSAKRFKIETELRDTNQSEAESFSTSKRNQDNCNTESRQNCKNLPRIQIIAEARDTNQSEAESFSISKRNQDNCYTETRQNCENLPQIQIIAEARDTNQSEPESFSTSKRNQDNCNTETRQNCKNLPQIQIIAEARDTNQSEPESFSTSKRNQDNCYTETRQNCKNLPRIQIIAEARDTNQSEPESFSTSKRNQENCYTETRQNCKNLPQIHMIAEASIYTSDPREIPLPSEKDFSNSGQSKSMNREDTIERHNLMTRPVMIPLSHGDNSSLMPSNRSIEAPQTETYRESTKNREKEAKRETMSRHSLKNWSKDQNSTDERLISSYSPKNSDPKIDSANKEFGSPKNSSKCDSRMTKGTDANKKESTTNKSSKYSEPVKKQTSLQPKFDSSNKESNFPVFDSKSGKRESQSKGSISHHSTKSRKSKNTWSHESRCRNVDPKRRSSESRERGPKTMDHRTSSKSKERLREWPKVRNRGENKSDPLKLNLAKMRNIIDQRIEKRYRKNKEKVLAEHSSRSRSTSNERFTQFRKRSLSPSGSSKPCRRDVECDSTNDVQRRKVPESSMTNQEKAVSGSSKDEILMSATSHLNQISELKETIEQMKNDHKRELEILQGVHRKLRQSIDTKSLETQQMIERQKTDQKEHAETSERLEQAHKSEILKLEEKIKTENEEVEKLRQLNNDFIKFWEGKKTEHRKIIRQMDSDYNEEIKNVLDNRRELTKTFESKIVELKESKCQMETNLRQEIDETTKEKETSKSKVVKLEKSLHTLRQQNAYKIKYLERTNAELEEKVDKLSHEATEFNMKKSKLKATQEKLKRTEESHRQQADQIERAERQIQEATTQIRTQEMELKTLKLTLKNARCIIHKLSLDGVRQQNQLTKLEKAKIVLSKKLKEIKTREDHSKKID